MTPSLQKILESKRALRRELAARPVAEKLRMLEAMRERDVSISRPIQTDTLSR